MLVINTESVVINALEELEHNRLIPDYEKNEKEIREISSIVSLLPRLCQRLSLAFSRVEFQLSSGIPEQLTDY
jgi:hypothetical protein